MKEAEEEGGRETREIRAYNHVLPSCRPDVGTETAKRPPVVRSFDGFFDSSIDKF